MRVLLSLTHTLLVSLSLTHTLSLSASFESRHVHWNPQTEILNLKPCRVREAERDASDAAVPSLRLRQQPILPDLPDYNCARHTVHLEQGAGTTETCIHGEPSSIQYEGLQ
jgi:hypothetical protein